MTRFRVPYLILGTLKVPLVVLEDLPVPRQGVVHCARAARTAAVEQSSHLVHQFAQLSTIVIVV